MKTLRLEIEELQNEYSVNQKSSKLAIIFQQWLVWTKLIFRLLVLDLDALDAISMGELLENGGSTPCMVNA